MAGKEDTGAESLKAKCDAMTAENLARLRKLNLTFDETLILAANLMTSVAVEQELVEELTDEMRQNAVDLAVLSASRRKVSAELKEAWLEMRVEARNSVIKAVFAGVELQKTNAARRSAKRRVARDPRQAEKELIKQCWAAWRAEPGRYEGKAAFARDMLDKCSHLKSQKKIEDWCREWEASTEQAE